jgi:hypothetical protein
MRGGPGLSRPAVPTNPPSRLAAVRASTSDQASATFDNTGFSMQSQRVAVEVWGELVGDFIEGGAHAWTLEQWWVLKAIAADGELLDLFFDLLRLEGAYFRRRTTIRPLSHLSDSSGHLQAIRLSDAQIAKLQQILKQHFGLDYSTEEAQDAGRAILRFVGLKLYQQLEKDRSRDSRAERRSE